MYAKGIAITYGSYMRVSIVMVVDRGRLPYESYVCEHAVPIGLEGKVNTFLWPVEFLRLP